MNCTNETGTGQCDLQIYPACDLEMPELPARSILYNLPPVGVGTADVESLTGYISRLAQEHYLSPVVLLKNSVRNASELPIGIQNDSISSIVAGSLNGFGDGTKRIVEILQNATFRTDISATCLLSLKGKISNYKLLKKELAWCSVCYHEQRTKGKVVYDKLAWTLKDVDSCVIHRVPLLTKCPHCSEKLKVLSGKSRPGFCSKCLSWLGISGAALEEINRFRGHAEEIMELHRATSAGEFLERNSLFCISEEEIQTVFIKNLTELIEIFTFGNINDFAYRTGVWHVAIRRLLKGEVLPTIEMLFAICFPLEVKPIELFEKNNRRSKDKSNEVNSFEKPVTKSEMEKYLKNILSEVTPVSASEVERRTDWTIERIKRNFPDEYKLVVEKYAGNVLKKNSALSDVEIESILIESLKGNPPLPLQTVFKRIGCRNTGYRYYQRFPELCKKITSRYEKANNKNFDIEKAEKMLKAALQEYPPPSFSQVAKRLNCKRGTLDRRLPELSKLLHEKYKSYLTESQRLNRQELYSSVKNVISELQKDNLTISENRVKKNLKRKWREKNFKEVYREILKEK